MDDVRSVLARYGFFRLDIAPLDKSNFHGAATTKLAVKFTGKMQSDSLVALVWPLMRWRPMRIHVWTTKRKYISGNLGVRPAIIIEWSGDEMRTMLDAIEWQTGNKRIDRKLLAYKRWLTYRATSWSNKGPWGSHAEPSPR